jgi:hypothetical protein
MLQMIIGLCKIPVMSDGGIGAAAITSSGEGVSCEGFLLKHGGFIVSKVFDAISSRFWAVALPFIKYMNGLGNETMFFRCRRDTSF